MKPPVCRVCGRDFAAAHQRGEGGLLHFRRSEDHEELAEEETGHPDNQAWFCPDHVDAATELTHLTLSEALNRFDDQI